MEAAGALPPTDKFGRTTKSAARPAGATAKPVVAQNAEAESEDEDSDEIPMLMEEDDTLEADGDEELLEHHEDSDSKNPPEIDPAA